MSVNKSRSVTWTLIILLSLLAVATATIWGRFAALSIRVSLADEQTEVFASVVSQALKSDISHCIADLEYIMNYYPSGTKQVKGSRLDAIVERYRQSAMREIISHLRKTSGKDYGEQPDEWIKNLSPSSKKN